jgi:hypothetical protein
MNYDYTRKNDRIDYGFVLGDHRIVFVKPGLGTDCMGFEHKYLRMARRLRDTYGCSVIVASNPHDGRSHADSDKAMLEQYMAENPIDPSALYFFGSSNGCIKGLELTGRGVAFRRMVLVNMPLMINFHKTKGYISAIPRTEILADYGELDPSISYVPFLRGRFENAEVMIVAGADHNFKGMIEAFISLSDRLLT